ncbi:MAG: hypothetical protein ACI8RZ_008021, partial [Myxococcota bacterium]
RQSLLLLLHGCLGALLEAELVIGEELSAIEIPGEPLSLLGTAVAIGSEAGEAVVIIGAPGSGEVLAVNALGVEQWRLSGGVGLGRRVWADEDAAYAWLPGVGVLDGGGEVVLRAPDATALARCPDGGWWTGEGIGDALDCAEGGLIRSTCAEVRCTVSLEETPGGDAEVLGETSAGSAVGWVGGQACWGDAALEDDPHPGALHCADGSSLLGLDGDHLGAVIGADRTAGVFNKWQVPARVRIVSADGGPVWALDRAAERSRVSLAEGEGLVAVGLPGFISESASEGRVYLVTP